MIPKSGNRFSDKIMRHVKREGSMKIDGRCACGYLSFEAEADPQQVSICHCTDCQAGTGSAFRVSIRVPGHAFKMLSGEPTTYLKTTADSGNPRLQAFCPKCGSPLYSTSPGDNPDSYMLRVGTLRQRNELMPKQQNWFRSALPWVTELASIPRNATGRPSKP
jgi:hypothetical protein